LPIEQKKLELKKRDNDLVNTFTVIIPVTIYFALQGGGIPQTQAMFIGLLVGTIFRVLFFLSNKKKL